MTRLKRCSSCGPSIGRCVISRRCDGTVREVALWPRVAVVLAPLPNSAATVVDQALIFVPDVHPNAVGARDAAAKKCGDVVVGQASPERQVRYDTNVKTGGAVHDLCTGMERRRRASAASRPNSGPLSCVSRADAARRVFEAHRAHTHIRDITQTVGTQRGRIGHGPAERVAAVALLHAAGHECRWRVTNGNPRLKEQLSIRKRRVDANVRVKARQRGPSLCQNVDIHCEAFNERDLATARRLLDAVVSPEGYNRTVTQHRVLPQLLTLQVGRFAEDIERADYALNIVGRDGLARPWSNDNRVTSNVAACL